jgi:hypothetical protein
VVFSVAVFSTPRLDTAGTSHCALSAAPQDTRGDATPDTHWTGAWVGPKVGLDAVEKRTNLSPVSEHETFRPDCSTSLCRLSYQCLQQHDISVG